MNVKAALAALMWPFALAAANLVEISVDLKLDETNYVAGEKIRGVVDIKNVTPGILSAGFADSPDRFIVEIFDAANREQLTRTSDRPFIASFLLKPNEGQKFEVFLGEHYYLLSEGRYLARPVLIHDGHRYEGLYRSFDVVEGLKVASALQMFVSDKSLRREFTLVRWTRNGYEHLFLKAKDSGGGDRRWHTTDIGPLLKITKPVISIMPSGQVVVIHRNGADSFIRSEFWSLPDVLDFRSRSSVLDPETAGQARVKQIYDEAGGVQPDKRPWWKFW